MKSLGHHLIAYIRSWQDALNKAAASRGLSGFRFNTYVISALVIFFLQVKQKLPKLANVPATQAYIDHVPHVEKEILKRWISEFFKFYGHQYDVANHVISHNIGEWQNRNMRQQAGLTSEQERFDNLKKLSIDVFAFLSLNNCNVFVIFHLDYSMPLNRTHSTGRIAQCTCKILNGQD